MPKVRAQPRQTEHSDAEQRELQKQFGITPKTAGLLIQAGYHNYRDLKDVSPNHVLEQFKHIPGLQTRLVEGYRRGLRRIVWLATQDEPELGVKICKDWTNKGLKERGMWRDNYDSLTGTEANLLFIDSTQQSTKASKAAKTTKSTNSTGTTSADID